MRDPRLVPFRAPALAFSAYLVLQAASGAVLFVSKLGTDLLRVQEFYLGAEARFAAPKSLGGLLLVAVPHLVAMPLVLFAASHVVGFARALGPRTFRALVGLSFGSALCGIAAGFAVRWLSPEFAWMKIGAFVALETALLGWAALLLVLFWPHARAEEAGAEEEDGEGSTAGRPLTVRGAPR